jgi:hypothetical protein
LWRATSKSNETANSFEVSCLETQLVVEKTDRVATQASPHPVTGNKESSWSKPSCIWTTASPVFLSLTVSGGLERDRPTLAEERMSHNDLVVWISYRFPILIPEYAMCSPPSILY